jgi:uncharacterized protein YndB with AHSA1/START domain
MHRWLVRVAAVVLLTLVALAFLAYRTPPDHIAVSEADFNAPPDRIWTLISDPERFAEWRDDVTEVVILDSAPGTLEWLERSSFGNISYRATEVVENERFRAEVNESSMAYTGGWTYELLPRSGGGTTVRITERGHIENRFMAAMARLMGLNASMDAALRALGGAVGEPGVLPRHVGSAVGRTELPYLDPPASPSDLVSSRSS